jgi:sec-independent protein translocase protein TatB
MFDLSWSHLMVVLVVAVVVIGPKDLPRVLRSVGRWSGQVKRMARDFQNQFNEALREAELEGVQKEVEELSKMDPMADVQSELAKTNTEIMTELNKPVETPAGAAAAAEPPPAKEPLAAPSADPGLAAVAEPAVAAAAEAKA